MSEKEEESDNDVVELYVDDETHYERDAIQLLRATADAMETRMANPDKEPIRGVVVMVEYNAGYYMAFSSQTADVARRIGMLEHAKMDVYSKATADLVLEEV